jgi:predicted DNA-binding protein (UPF0251 family)
MARRREDSFAPSEAAIQAADWRPIEGFPAYEVSNNGYVRNARTGCVLKPEVGHRGHLRVTLYIGSREAKQRIFVHRLVLLAFVGPPPEDRQDCAHWDGNPSNNSITNLRWATKSENADDARRHGTLVLGEKNRRAKLTNVQANEIRMCAVAGTSTGDLASKFGISLETVNRIVTGRTWAHLGGVIHLPTPRWPVDESAAIAAAKAMQEGASLTQSARRFGISRQTLTRRLTSAPEKLIQGAVLEHWRNFALPHTLVAAIPNQFSHGMAGLTPGIADLLVLAPGLPVAFLELKRDYASPMSDAQRDFAALCLKLGVRFALTYGRDEPIRQLELCGAVRPQAVAA